MTVTEVFDDVAGLLAQMDPAKIVALKAPQMMAKRVEVLIDKKKDSRISLEETSELERYLALDMLINLAKARAYRLLAA